MSQYYQELPRYQLAAIPGAGQGFRACMPIARGTLILKERPLFVIPCGHDTDARVDQEVARLSLEDRQQFQLLASTHHFLSRPEETNRGRFITNALPIGRNAALFLSGSRFNNSCKPNVHSVWNARENSMEFRVMKDVLPGEELCIAYNVRGLLAPRSVRAAAIMEASGFRCICPACIQPPKSDLVGSHNAMVSDSNRKWLKDVILGKSDPTRGNFAQNLQNLAAALQALAGEEIYQYRDTLFYDGYRVCVAAGDGVHAIQWLQRAYESAVTVVGHEHEEVVGMWKLLNNPTAIPNGNPNTMMPPPVLSQ